MKDWSKYDLELYVPQNPEEALDILRYKMRPDQRRGWICYADGKATGCALTLSMHIVKALIGGEDRDWEGTVCHSSYDAEREKHRRSADLHPLTGGPMTECPRCKGPEYVQNPKGPYDPVVPCPC